MTTKRPTTKAIRYGIGFYLTHNAEGFEQTFLDISKLWGLSVAIEFLEDATGQSVGKTEEYQNHSDVWIANQIIARAEHY